MPDPLLSRRKKGTGKTGAKGLEKEKGKDQEKEGRIVRRGTGEVERQTEGVRKRGKKGAGQGRVESEPLPKQKFTTTPLITMITNMKNAT